MHNGKWEYDLDLIFIFVKKKKTTCGEVAPTL